MNSALPAVAARRLELNPNMSAPSDSLRRIERTRQPDVGEEREVADADLRLDYHAATLIHERDDLALEFGNAGTFHAPSGQHRPRAERLRT